MNTQYKVFTLPAICNNCSSVFPSGLSVGIGNAGTATFKGNKSGPCPSCGGWGDVIDGSFTLVGDTIRRLTDGLSISDIVRLKAIAEKAQSGKSDLRTVSSEISQIPGLEAFAQWFVGYFTPKSGGDLFSYLGFLLSVISLILTMQPTDPIQKALTEEQIIQMTVKVVNESFNKPASPNVESNKTATSSRRKVKIGRNDPCHCRSGKKHKHCCL